MACLLSAPLGIVAVVEVLDRGVASGRRNFPIILEHGKALLLPGDVAGQIAQVVGRVALPMLRVSEGHRQVSNFRRCEIEWSKNGGYLFVGHC